MALEVLFGSENMQPSGCQNPAVIFNNVDSLSFDDIRFEKFDNFVETLMW